MAIFYLKGSKTDGCGDVVQDAVFIVQQTDVELIAEGACQRPRDDMSYGVFAFRKRDEPVFVVEATSFEEDGAGRVLRGVGEFDLDGVGASYLGREVNGEVEESCGIVVGVEGGDEIEVDYVDPGKRVQLYGTEDAAWRRRFDERAIGVAVDAKCNSVTSAGEIACDFPFGWRETVFGVSYDLSVDEKADG